MDQNREKFEIFAKSKFRSNTKLNQSGCYADKITERMYQSFVAGVNSNIKNGERIYIVGSDRFVGLFVGVNPSTDSLVCFNEESGEYRSFHHWQVCTK